MNRHQIKHSIMLLLTAVIWGSSFVAQSAGMDHVGPFTFSAARFIIGSIVLLPVILIFSDKGTKEQNKYTVMGGICCGIVMFAAANLQQIAMLHSTTGKAGFITALYIVIVPLLGKLFGKKCTPLIWISVLLSVIGLYLLCIGIGGTFVPEASDFLLLGCSFLFSVHILVIDHFTDKADGLKMSCVQFFTAGVLNIPLMFTLDGSIFQMAPSVSNLLAAFLPVLYAGVLASGVGYTLQVIGQKGMNPTIASLLLSLESVTAALSGFIFLNQKLSFSEILGCIIMFIAIILAQLPIAAGTSNDS